MGSPKDNSELTPVELVHRKIEQLEIALGTLHHNAYREMLTNNLKHLKNCVGAYEQWLQAQETKEKLHVDS